MKVKTILLRLVLSTYSPNHLRNEYFTLPEALKKQGYKTFAGKWHLGEEGSWPEDHGIDINKGGWCKGNPIGSYGPWETPNLASGLLYGESLTIRVGKGILGNLFKN